MTQWLLVLDPRTMSQPEAYWTEVVESGFVAKIIEHFDGLQRHRFSVAREFIYETCEVAE